MEAKVEIYSLGVCEAMNPICWPSGSFLQKNICDHLSIDTITLIRSSRSQIPGGISSDAEYLQAALRHALLRKFGYSRSIPSEIAPQHLQINEIHVVQQLWEDVVKQICRKQCMNTHEAATNLIDNEVLGAASVATEKKDFGESISECCEPASSIYIDFMDFIVNQCCLSNNRQLEWSVMSCPPGVQFQLHAHPNIEVIYCIRGSLHEVRMNGPPVTRRFEEHGSDNFSMTKVSGPELTYLQRSWSFGTLNSSQWLVNEVGSIHKSFTSSTSDGGCDLLVLWGGSHANISHPPITPNIQKAVDFMDGRLQMENFSSENSDELCCFERNGTIITAKFLPESEKTGLL